MLQDSLNILKEQFGKDSSKVVDAAYQAKAAIDKLIKQSKPITSKPEVKILADSINEQGNRLTTFELTFWRAILPELSRHRCFSLSVRSSRANPISNLRKEIEESPWGPCEWGINQKGMAAEKTIDDKEVTSVLNYLWYQSAMLASNMAETLEKAHVHKQIVNRLLEPYTCTHVVLSGTEFNNFYKLRIAKDAQPEIRELAIMMKEAQEHSEPELLVDKWHLPYISTEDREAYKTSDLCRMSAARCARVSYKTYSGDIHPEADLALYTQLVNAGHYSPLEHVALPTGSKGEYMMSNFKGWNQLRKFEED